MFTGLIVETGSIDDVRKLSGIMRLTVETPTLHKDAEIGDSISVNGVCLTVTAIRNDRISFELSEETLRSTCMQQVKRGDIVNLEPSLRADGKIGGHFVTGHIDGTGKIVSMRRVGDTVEVEISVPEEILTYLVDKGSVAVDGISLTVVKVLRGSFRLVIIPHSAKITNLSLKREGDCVNIETDVIGKYVRKFTGPGADESFMRKLSDGGFIGRP
ncbi:MAG: riboflavin synthase [Thermodesulfovibrionales bacterium]